MSRTGRSIPRKTKAVTHVKLIKAFEQYCREAEEHEDDDIIRDTSAEGRLNDFAIWFFNVRFKRV